MYASIHTGGNQWNFIEATLVRDNYFYNIKLSYTKNEVLLFIWTKFMCLVEIFSYNY